MSGTEARRLVSGCVAVAIALAAATQAPASELRIGAQTQRPNVVYSQLIIGTGNGCLLDTVDGSWGFPTPLVVSPGSHQARIVYRRAERPERVEVVASHALDGHGKPSDPMKRLDAVLGRTRGSGGEGPGWRVTFTLKTPLTYYLTVATRWPRDQSCGLDSQSLVTYSVTARGAPAAGPAGP